MSNDISFEAAPVDESADVRTIFGAIATPAAICIAGLALFWSLPAAAQSFPCAEASKPAEFAICNSENLLIMDENMNKIFTTVYQSAATAPQRQSVVRRHNGWRLKRDACGNDFTCLNLRYQERLSELRSS